MCGSLGRMARMPSTCASSRSGRRMAVMPGLQGLTWAKQEVLADQPRRMMPAACGVGVRWRPWSCYDELGNAHYKQSCLTLPLSHINLTPCCLRNTRNKSSENATARGKLWKSAWRIWHNGRWSDGHEVTQIQAWKDVMTKLSYWLTGSKSENDKVTKYQVTK